jgi:hypothetical protein
MLRWTVVAQTSDVIAHPGFRRALRAPGRARVLGHGRAMRAGLAVDLEAEADLIDVGGAEAVPLTR